MFLAFGIFVFVTVKAYLDPVDETTVYGSRLEGIDKVPITDDRKKEIEDFIKEDKSISSASLSVKGKIVNVIINVSSKEKTLEDVQKLCNSVLEKFKKEEIDFYDFQFFVENKEANYVSIGYKNKKNGSISWSHDEIEKSEVEVDEKKEQ